MNRPEADDLAGHRHGDAGRDELGRRSRLAGSQAQQGDGDGDRNQRPLAEEPPANPGRRVRIYLFQLEL